MDTMGAMILKVSIPAYATKDDLLLDALAQTSYAVHSAISAVAARHDISITLLRVIEILRDHTPAMTELAEHLGLDKSSVTGLVDRAVTRGLLHKVPDELDRRSRKVALTDAGQHLAETCRAQVKVELSSLTSQLTQKQGETLASLLPLLSTLD